MSIVKDLNHVGLIVPDVDKACTFFETVFGIKCSEAEQLVPDLKIRFAILKNAKLEIIQPLTEDSDHAKFLKEHPKGGIHHICYHTENLEESAKKLKEVGVKPLSEGPLELMNGGKVRFFDPEDTFGILTELTSDY
jgi:methylmalonyl-CoA/ethylmalonyl-CoA epimerase